LLDTNDSNSAKNGAAKMKNSSNDNYFSFSSILTLLYLTWQARPFAMKAPYTVPSVDRRMHLAARQLSPAADIPVASGWAALVSSEHGGIINDYQLTAL
jgi:hypothetical protein